MVIKNINCDMKNSLENEDEFSKKINNLFNNLPQEFDKWTIQEQDEWLKETIWKDYSNISEIAMNLILASCRQLIWNRPLDKLPEWLDINKYRRGQKFINNNIFGILICKILCLIFAYIFNVDAKPFILGGHIHTPYLSVIRYNSTLIKMINWFNGMPWIKGTQAYKDMAVTRRMHLAMRAKICRLSYEELDAKTKIANPWSPDREMLLGDFVNACPFRSIEERIYKAYSKSPNKPKAFNNADISVLQGCFVLFPVLYPQKFGIHDATDEDLEAFCHMWRYYGYALGLEDECNFCRGSLAEIKERLKYFEESLIKPNFKNIEPEWEHITRCLIKSVNYVPFFNLPYKTAVLLTTDSLDLNMPRLYASLNYIEWFYYKLYQFALQYMMKFSFVRTFFNQFALRRLESIKNYSPKKMEKIASESEKLVPHFSID